MDNQTPQNMPQPPEAPIEEAQTPVPQLPFDKTKIGFALLIIIIIGLGSYIVFDKTSPSTQEALPENQSANKLKPTTLPSEFNSYTHASTGYSFNYPEGTVIEESPDTQAPDIVTINDSITVLYRDQILDASTCIGDCAYWDATTTTQQIGQHNVTIVKSAGGLPGDPSVMRHTYYIPTPAQGQYLTFIVSAASRTEESQLQYGSPPVEKYQTVPADRTALVEYIISSLTFSETRSRDMSSDTAWAEFSDPTSGLSFEYPQSWRISDANFVSQNNLITSVEIWGPTQETQTELYDGARFSVMKPIEAPTDVETWVRSNYQETVNGDPYVIAQESIGGRDFTTAYGCGLGCFTYYFMEENEKIYGFITIASGNEENMYKNHITRMLESLRIQ